MNGRGADARACKLKPMMNNASTMMPKKIAKPRTRKATATGVVGPHNGCELELMLSGTKPLARFAKEPVPSAQFKAIEAAFKPHVRRGTVRRFQFKGEDFDRVYYCLPTEEWRVKLLELIDTSLEAGAHKFTITDLQRIDGAILGYTKADVEYFIARWRRHHRNA